MRSNRPFLRRKRRWRRGTSSRISRSPRGTGMIPCWVVLPGRPESPMINLLRKRIPDLIRSSLRRSLPSKTGRFIQKRGRRSPSPLCRRNHPTPPTTPRPRLPTRSAASPIGRTTRSAASPRRCARSAAASRTGSPGRRSKSSTRSTASASGTPMRRRSTCATTAFRATASRAVPTPTAWRPPPGGTAR